MRRIRRRTFARCAFAVGLAIVLTQVAPARADNMGVISGMSPSHGHKMSPAVAVTGGVVRAPWRVSLIYGQMSMDDRKILADGERIHRSHHMTMSRSGFGAVLGLPKDLQVSASIPFRRIRADGVMHATAVNDTGGTGFSFNGKSVGQGDLMVQLKKRFLIGSLMRGAHIAVIAGVEAPTGKDDGRFDEVNLATSGYYPGSDPGRLPLRMQPGSGSWDSLVGVAYSQSIGHITVHGNINYKRTGRGFDKVRLGRRLLVGAAAAMHISGGLAISGDVLFRTDGDDDYPNADVDAPATVASANPMASQLQRGVLRGATQNDPILYVVPGVSYTFGDRGRVSGGLLIPTLTGDDGVIPNPAFIVRVVVNAD